MRDDPVYHIFREKEGGRRGGQGKKTGANVRERSKEGQGEKREW